MSEYELSANSEEEFEEKLKNLAKLIQARKPQIAKIQNTDEYVAFIRDFEAAAQTTRPVSMDEAGAIDPAQLAILREKNYPEDYIAWASKYGHCNFWIESTRISTLSSVIKEIDGYYGMLAANNFLLFTTDGGGNMFGFDRNEAGCNICFFDHNNYITEDSVEEIYSDIYGFYYNDETETHENPNKLDEKLVYDEAGNYILNSVYIRDYLKDPEVSRPVKADSFLSFLLQKTEEGFDNIIHRYYYELEMIADDTMGDGELEEGVAYYDVLIDACPDHDLAYNNRACNYREAGMYEEALIDVKKALELKDSDELYHGTLAEILFDLGDLEGFYSSFEAALKRGMEAALIDEKITEKLHSEQKFIALTAKYAKNEQ